MKYTRTAGLSAIIFAIAIFSINVVENIGNARPDPAAATADVIAWAVEADAYLWVTTLMVPLSWFALVFFAVNVWEWSRSSGRAMFWPTLGLLGSGMTMGTLSAAIAADAALIKSVNDLSHGTVEFLTAFSTVLFIVNWAALSLALLGLSRAVFDLGMIPTWAVRVCVVGSGLLIVGAIQSGPVLQGFLPPVLIGLPGFIIWLLFLAYTGVGLVRRSENPNLV